MGGVAALLPYQRQLTSIEQVARFSSTGRRQICGRSFLSRSVLRRSQDGPSNRVGGPAALFRVPSTTSATERVCYGIGARSHGINVIYNTCRLRPSTHEYAGKLFSSRVTWHRSKKELVQERQRGLELYLNRLLNDPALAQNGMVYSCV